MEPNALVLFDIDGTLLRRAGPHHRQVLEDAVLRVTGRAATTDGIPVAGMLDGQILRLMMAAAGLQQAEIRAHLPAIMEKAQSLYARRCPDLRGKVCPGVRMVLSRLARGGVPTGLVTGNLSRIAWRKMHNAGLKERFRFGAFAEQGATRAALIRRAVREARLAGWIGRGALITMVGDHPNDILAARAAGVRSLAVGTGIVAMDELRAHAPDLLLEDLRALDHRWLLTA
ncbi:MAG: haloacid dehalogenase-like hydrolase [Acidobacteria bacterium]|nr:haloacid dehalogenase-like hydrolase [Acidobacteriota bacterium]